MTLNDAIARIVLLARQAAVGHGLTRWRLVLEIVAVAAQAGIDLTSLWGEGGALAALTRSPAGPVAEAVDALELERQRLIAGVAAGGTSRAAAHDLSPAVCLVVSRLAA